MLAGDVNAAGGDSYASLLADIHELNRTLADASMVSGSKEYGNVREYAKYIEQELKGMQGNIAGPIAEKDEFKRNHVKEMMGNLRDLSEAYLWIMSGCIKRRKACAHPCFAGVSFFTNR